MSSFFKTFFKAIFWLECPEGRAKWGHQVRKQDGSIHVEGVRREKTGKKNLIRFCRSGKSFLAWIFKPSGF